MSRLYNFDIDELKKDPEHGNFSRRKVWLLAIVCVVLLGLLIYDASFTPDDFDVQYIEYRIEEDKVEPVKEYNPLGFAEWNSVKGPGLYDDIDDIEKIKALRDSIVFVKASLVREVNRYIQDNFPGSPLSPNHIVNMCEKRKFDITLLMSQTHIESAFGLRTGGTNSCFGVISKSFSNPNNSVDHYIDLMQSHYTKDRTVEELFASRFKRVDGNYHYAEDPDYTEKIRNTRNNIIASTNINSLFGHLMTLNNEYTILVNNYKTIE